MTNEAHEFLQLIRPKGGLIVLAAMLPDRGAPNVMTYEVPDEIGEALAWMNEMAALGCNIYYQHQHVADRHLSKLRKEDITEISFLHADIDWKVRDHRIKATPEMIQSRVTGLKTSPVAPPPSIIVCSGNGIQALWRLESPVDVQMAERANKKLQDLVLADEGTWNADRLLRMPGYVNRPSKQKRLYGIENSQAYLIEASDKAFPIESFPLAEIAAVRKAFEVSADIEEVTDLEALNIPQVLREIIECGESSNPDYSPADTSRSGWLMYATTWLVGCGVPDAQIMGILLNPLWCISETVLECNGYSPEAYARRQVSRAKAHVKAKKREAFPLLSTEDVFGDD